MIGPPKHGLIYLMLLVMLSKNPSLSIYTTKSEIASEIDISPANGSDVVGTLTATDPPGSYDYWETFDFQVKSDIPVSLVRYNDHNVDGANWVLGVDEVQVYVTTNCSDDFGEVSITVDEIENVPTLEISISRDDVSPVLLPSSNFQASWNYTSYWCMYDPFDDDVYDDNALDDGVYDDDDYDSTSPLSPLDFPESVPPKSSPAPMSKYAIRSGPAGHRRQNAIDVRKRKKIIQRGVKNDEGTLRQRQSTTTKNSIPVRNTHQNRYLVIDDIFEEDSANDKDTNTTTKTTCAITAEVLYDPCFRNMTVEAPSLRITDVSLGLYNSSKTDVECKTNHRAAIEGPVLSEELQSDELPFTYLPLTQDCGRAIEGRPYIDVEGNLLQAEAVISDNSCWSQSAESLSSNNKNEDKNLASDWMERSLAEHASIASFASFTISLLTNAAPPELIRDALRAALDEVEHATTSFELASLFSSQKNVEPGPLPRSSHDFRQDVGGLVESTFREGCVDETLSALAAGYRADVYGACEEEGEEDGGGCETEGMLRQKLIKIALDEARHSGLAWRTILWACSSSSVNSARCWESLRVWDKSKLSLALQRRFPSFYGDILAEWERIHETLLPFVTGRESVNDWNGCGLYEDKLRLNYALGEKTVVEEVADRVISEVMCGSSTKNNVDSMQ